MKPEESLQRTCVALLRLYEARGWLSYCHVPNGGQRTKAEAGVFKALGTRAGVPDLLVFLPGGVLLQVELKAGRGKLSPAQRAWHETMKSLGFRVTVCWSVEDLEADLWRLGVPMLRAVGPLNARKSA
jgi:hypothetical protein